MPFIGNKPSAIPLTSADIADGIITSAKIANDAIVTGKIADGTIVNADIDASAAIAGTKISGSFGKVLQVVTASTTTSYTTTSSSYVAAAGMEVSITPSSATSKVLIFVNMNFEEGVAGSGAYATIYRNNSTNLEANGFVYHGLRSGASYKFASQEPMHFLDTPNTTSATTYTVYFSRDTSGEASVNRNSARGVITAMEIGA
jgi:hypothetical protein